MIYIETEEYHWDGPKQPLPGFDTKYKNVVDYILTITEEIWEQKAIEVINDTYDENIIIHQGATVINGIQNVIDGTIKMLASFPDRKMLGEAVIWSAEERGHFYSSHRIASTATNKGRTAFGKATGKAIFFRTIADCAITKNKIYEEWLVRDNLAILEQLGFDPVEMARRFGDYDGKKSLAYQAYAAPSNGQTNVCEISGTEEMILSLFDSGWAKRNKKAALQHYAPGSTVHAIRNQDLLPEQNADFFISVLSSFPDGVPSVERITSNKRKGQTEIAARWKLTGTHAAEGFFGSASNVPVILRGISHFLVNEEGITEEWTVFDAFDLLCQIHAKPEAKSVPSHLETVVE